MAIRRPTEPRDYLRAALQLNPVEQSARILRCRTQFLGLQSSEPAAPDRAEEQAKHRVLRRQHARTRIEQLRNEFWTAPLGTVRDGIASLDVSDFPELRPALDRLHSVLVHRPRFPQLAAEPDRESNLFKALQKIVVQAPQEAAATRERFLRWLQGRPERVRPVKRMIRLLQRKFPELYELESEWLEHVKQVRSSREESVTVHGGGGGGSFGEFGIPPWLIIVAIIMLARILFYVLR